MKAILVLMDSLNRHFLTTYGADWVRTPNIARFAESSVTFDNHWIGSAPCMPARKDMFTGRLSFLEKQWGGLEPFDVPFTRLLRDNGVFTHMETDHYHYFHVGGECYHTQFDSWEFHRGQEEDVHVSRVERPPEPEHLGLWSDQYVLNKTRFATEADYPSPQTYAGAIEWLRANQDADDWFLWIEAFDPHEPFDCPQEYVDLYDDTWDGPIYNWSHCEVVDGEGEAVRHLQKLYAATLTMTDRWFGKLLEELERQNRFEDTLIILTTDHGHMLGQHNVTSKSFCHAWNELAHIPLMVHLPGGRHAGQRRRQLTQNVDLTPTILEHFGIGFDHPIHGESWMKMIEDDAPARRNAVLYGWHGSTVNVADGDFTYLRAPATEANQPLYHYFLTPTSFGWHDLPGKGFFRDAEFGNFLPYTDFSVIRARSGGKRRPHAQDTLLFDQQRDPGQQTNLVGQPVESKYVELLIETMKRMDSPAEQFERLGLTRT